MFIRRIYFLLCCFALPLLLPAQDLYDYANSMKFARHLVNSRQYQLAAHEYERMLFMAPENDTLKLTLLQTYRKGELLQTGLQRAGQLYPEPQHMPRMVAMEYTKIILLSGAYRRADTVAEQLRQLTATEQLMLRMNAAMAAGAWERAAALYQQSEHQGAPMLQPYLSIMEQGLNRPRRSPALALAMSTIVPGTGKVYAGKWKDGLFSFIFIGGSAFQAYRGFSQQGMDSVHGWAFGSISFAFYLGNLYGSIKAAQQFNQKTHDHLVEQVKSNWATHF